MATWHTTCVESLLLLSNISIMKEISHNVGGGLGNDRNATLLLKCDSPRKGICLPLNPYVSVQICETSFHSYAHFCFPH